MSTPAATFSSRGANRSGAISRPIGRQARESELRLDSFGKVRLWQEIALSLLKKYTERYCAFRKREWELPQLEYRDLAGDDPNLPTVREEPGEYGYRILVEKSRRDVVARLEELKAAIEGGALKPWAFQGLGAVWLLAGDRQHVAFVDPKGIRNVGVDDPKIRFFETIKEIERRLGDPKVALDSFIVSNTPSHVMEKLWRIGKPEMAARHIAFQEEDQGSYIGAILHGIESGRALGSGR